MAADEVRKEAVYTVTDYYDGPRRGVADFHGMPHAYESLFDDSEDEGDGTFLLRPLDPPTLALVVEDWELFLRWRRAFDEGRTTLDTHPALPADRPRHDEIKPILDERLRIVPATTLRAKGHFAVVEGEWKVSWSVDG
jgi:hypothetical protein